MHDDAFAGHDTNIKKIWRFTKNISKFDFSEIIPLLCSTLIRNWVIFILGQIIFQTICMYCHHLRWSEIESAKTKYLQRELSANTPACVGGLILRCGII